MRNSKSALPLKLAVMVLSVMLIVTFSFTGQQLSYAYGATNGGVVSADPVDVMISLSADESHEVLIPVKGMPTDDLQAAIDEGKIELSLIRDKTKPYPNDQYEENMFPNQKDGGVLSSWKAQNGSDMFSNIKMEPATVDGAICLKLTFDSNCYFYSRNNPDYSAPHNNGGAYLDICGYFDLIVTVDNAEKGFVTAKVTPYHNFHTMDEVYADIDAMADYPSKRYVEKFSMGQSTFGRDMPYLIVAKDREKVDKWLEYTELVETDPDAALAKIKAGEIDDIAVPVLYSNIHSNEVAAVDGIIDFAWKLIKEDTIPYKYLEGFTTEGQAEYEKEMGEVGKANSTAVPDLIKDSATYLGWLTAGNSRSAKVDLEKYYNISDNTYDIDKVLDDIFFILVPEENVDGRAQDTRVSAAGYDLNRDNSFQTTSETANMQRVIGTYNPVSHIEFHGRVTAFQCEPCDPPHEPNFEYDQLARNLIPGGEAAGIAAVANNENYNSYVIPQRDYLVYTGEKTEDGKDETYWADPWDDMSTSYTPQYAMLHGAAAYTIELPAYSDDTTLLVSYGIIGNSAYVAKNKAEYMDAQATIYKRGVDNANSDAYDMVGQWLCDQYDVEGAEMDLFRPEYKGEGENGNFFPEAYIIPVDSKNQKNLDAAEQMGNYLARNDVKVYPATKEFTLDGKTYPEGTLIVPMYQAKRSVANGVLNNGTLINSWTVLYSEGITAFNKTRGFDMITTAKPADYEVLKGAMGEALPTNSAKGVLSVGSSFEGVEGYDVIIDNVSEDSTAAVNALLKKNKVVGMITEGENKGDFITKFKNYDSIKAKYDITATGVNLEETPVVAKNIELPKVFILGKPGENTSGYRLTSYRGTAIWNYDRATMELLNFKTVDDPDDATVIVGGSSLSGAALNAVKDGTPLVTYTSTGASNANKVVSGTTRVGLSGAMDCLAYVEYPEETLVNATYINEGDDIMYGYNAGYFSAIPEGAKALVKVSNKTPLEGFIPTQTASRKTAFENYLNGGILGYEYTDDEVDMAVFAQTMTNKVNQRDEYQYISNFIFSRNLADDYTVDGEKASSQDLQDMEQKVKEAEAALAAAQNASAEEIAALKAAVEAAKADLEAVKAEIAKAEEEKAKAKEEAAKVAAAKKLTVKGLKVKAGKKKAVVSFKKTKGAVAYQVQYKDGKKWKNAAKASKKVKVTVKKLKKGKKYGFRVRTISKVNGKTVYGKWTKVKTVKIK